MGILTRVREWFSPAPADNRASRIYEASSIWDSTKSVSDLIEEDAGWRKLSALAEKPILTMEEHGVTVRLASWFLGNSPLAVKILRTITAHILGAETQIDTEDEDLQKALEEFWTDPLNRLDKDAVKMCQEWLAYGELFLPVFVGRDTGKMHVGYLPPWKVSDVKTDPDNARVFTAVHETMEAGYPDRVWTVLNGAEPFDQDMWEQVQAGGNYILYFPLQMTVTGRGRSILEPAYYWIHRAEQFLNDRLMLNNFAKAWIWDVTVTGNDEDVKRIAQQVEGQGPVPGSVKVHNEATTWEAVSPNLHAGDAITDYIAVLKYLANAVSFPAHWVGAEDDVNRSTADSASMPTIKTLEILQDQFIDGVLLTLLQMQAEMFRLSGYLPLADDAAATVKLIAPDITAADNQQQADTLQKLAAAVPMLIEAGLLTVDDARSLIYTAADREIPADIDEQVAQAQADDVLRIYQQEQEPDEQEQEQTA